TQVRIARLLTVAVDATFPDVDEAAPCLCGGIRLQSLGRRDVCKLRVREHDQEHGRDRDRDQRADDQIKVWLHAAAFSKSAVPVRTDCLAQSITAQWNRNTR